MQIVYYGVYGLPKFTGVRSNMHSVIHALNDVLFCVICARHCSRCSGSTVNKAQQTVTARSSRPVLEPAVKQIHKSSSHTVGSGRVRRRGGTQEVPEVCVLGLAGFRIKDSLGRQPLNNLWTRGEGVRGRIWEWRGGGGVVGCAWLSEIDS